MTTTSKTFHLKKVFMQNIWETLDLTPVFVLRKAIKSGTHLVPFVVQSQQATSVHSGPVWAGSENLKGRTFHGLFVQLFPVLNHALQISWVFSYIYLEFLFLQLVTVVSSPFAVNLQKDSILSTPFLYSELTLQKEQRASRRSPLNLLFFKLIKPPSLSLFLYVRCMSPSLNMLSQRLDSILQMWAYECWAERVATIPDPLATILPRQPRVCWSLCQGISVLDC